VAREMTSSAFRNYAMWTPSHSESELINKLRITLDTVRLLRRRIGSHPTRNKTAQKNADIHQCLETDSNRRSQFSSGSRFCVSFSISFHSYSILQRLLFHSSYSPVFVSSSFIYLIFYFPILSLLVFDIFSLSLALFLTTYSPFPISSIVLCFSSSFFYFSSCLPFLYFLFSSTTFFPFVTGSSSFGHLLSSSSDICSLS
jgi:hypothetical protein